MKLRLTLATFTLAILSAAITAQAAEPAASGANMPRVDKREKRQEARIEQGVASGQLTSRETLRLEREQKHIATAEAKAEADGKVTGKEKARLDRMQDKASRDIHHQKHDKQAVPTK
jgi:hypothetical protein